VTIAAALSHEDGILLCSDTQQEAGAMKIHGSKIGHFTCPGGKVAFAIAGNVPFAFSAIQKCAKRVKEAAPDKDD
jgi:predicted proteasome-type protease